MKRSLAPPRRDRPAGLNPQLTKPITLRKPDQLTPSSSKPVHLSLQKQPVQKQPTQRFEQRYRNKNLNTLPTPLLVAMSTLTTLDISYNQLTDSQIQLIMNSCVRLSTLCIQGNLTNLIPASIMKLKLLVNFRHDWLKLHPQEMYEPVDRLQKIKETAKRPQHATKINKIVGIDFKAYCLVILQIDMDSNLAARIHKCDLSSHARDNMLKYLQNMSKSKVRDKVVTIHQGEEKALMAGCFSLYGLEQQGVRASEQRWRQIPSKKQPQKSLTLSEADTDYPANIKIQDIRDITQKTSAPTQGAKQTLLQYHNLSMPLHSLFANFDSNPQAAAQIDGLLLRGYNPNQYDHTGLSAYHICIVYHQNKGLQYLLDIAGNNPGFFDLQMPSTKQGRNILHFSVFLKQYTYAKMLVQFGMPTNKRDSSGARLVHLVDQNYEFLLLLRKMLKRRTMAARNVAGLSVPQLGAQNRKNYVKHPQREKEESRFRITYSRNDRLLDLYEQANGVKM